MINRLNPSVRAAIAFAGLGLLAAGCATPDLTPTRLDVSPTPIEQGETYRVSAEMANIGEGATRVRADGRAPSMRVALKGSPDPADFGETLMAFAADEGLEPGESQAANISQVMSADWNPGTYFICAEADFANLYEESDETNNNLCTAISVTARVLPDLVVDGAKSGASSGISRRVYINVSNTGGAVAENFRVDVYGADGWPILLTTCPLTALPSDGVAPCPSPFIERLEPGVTETVAAWVTFPADRTSGAVENATIAADGCHAPTEPSPLPAYCRVEETDEANNGFAKAIVVP